MARPIDLVVANLPYIPSAVVPELPVAASFEPREALDGGPDGLGLVRRLLVDLPRVLVAGGGALLEIGADQGDRRPAPARSVCPAGRPRSTRTWRAGRACCGRCARRRHAPGAEPCSLAPPGTLSGDAADPEECRMTVTAGADLGWASIADVDPELWTAMLASATGRRGRSS